MATWRRLFRHLVPAILVIAALGALAIEPRGLEGAQTQGLDDAPVRLDSGRFTILAWPADAQLARTLLSIALKGDTFPGLPRPRRNAVITIAPGEARFRDLIGPRAPEWGAAVAFPALGRIVLQGSWAGSDAGDPRVVLRHELAHLALHEFMGDIPPAWFDEGYASLVAGEWKRTEGLAANIFVLTKGIPSLERLDAGFTQGSMAAQATYALSHVAVENLAALDRERGLSLFLGYWRESRSMDAAVRRAYGLTLNGFEERWRKNVSIRYGWLALLTNLGIAVGLLFLLLAPFFVRRRRLLRARLAALRKSEAEAERRAVTEALSALLREGEEGGARS